MTWLKDNIANISVLSMVILLVCLCIKSLVDARKSGHPSCGCGRNCATCALACMHGHKKNTRKFAEE